MDFVHDPLADGRPLGSRRSWITGVDTVPCWRLHFACRGPASVRPSIASWAKGPGPRPITVDHGTEFQSRALEDWAYRRGVRLDFIRPGKPVEDAFIELFNGRLRDECLNVRQFASLSDAQIIIEAWCRDYNQRRPHGSLGNLTPQEFVERAAQTGLQEAPNFQFPAV